MSYDQLVRHAVPQIARALFAQIDHTAEYLIVRPNEAVRFNHYRLLKGKPVNLIGLEGQPDSRPIRDLTIYRITEDGSGTDEIALPWVSLLVTSEVADQKAGSELTVQDIYAAAYAYVAARLDELSHEE